MNYESRSPTPHTAQADTDAVALEEWESADDQPAKRRRRRLIVAAIALFAVIIAGAYFAFSGPAETPAAKGAGGGEQDNRTTPSITVVVPGRTTVNTVINSTGSLAARREMPVGVAGEGGQVLRVFVEPGQWVRQGQVLATVDRAVQTQQIAQLAAQIRVAEADARLAQSDLDRALALSGRGFVSTADVERRTAARDSAVARVRVAQAQLGEIRARTGRLDIRAPDAGLVLSRGVEPGQVVSPGSGVLFRIARGGEMELLAQVGEAELAQLSTGARATVTPVGSSTTFSGQIWQVSPVVDPQTRQGTARIALSYAAGLRPGGFASAQIIAAASQASVLPESAILHDDEGTYVLLINAQNKVERRAVTIGTVGAQGVPITSGLTGQEKVVLSAGAFLNVGDTVTPVMQRNRP